MTTEPARSPRSHTVRRVVFTLIAACVLIALVFYVFSPGPPWSGETLEVDIGTGHMRHRVYFLGLTPVNRVESTWVSDAIDRSAAKDNASDWQPVLDLELHQRPAAQPAFHGAVVQIRTLAVAKNLDVWTPDAELAIAQGLLERWRRGGSHAGARRFVDIIQQASLDAAHSKRNLTADDIRALKIEEHE